MSEISPDVRTRAIVSIQGNTFRIDTVSTYAAYGSQGTVPQIDKSTVLQEPSQVDSVNGKEGELILSMEDGSDAWLNGNGELVIAPNPSLDDENRYEIDQSQGDLLYNQGAEPLPVADNVLHEVGDIMHIAVNALIRGKITMNSFSDVFEGDGAVERQFRVKIQPMFYTEWLPLTNENLAAASYDSDAVLQIQIQYKRVSGTGDLSFSSLNITGVWEAGVFEAPTLLTSLFSSLMSSPLLKAFDDNIFKKLYFRGIVPRYITRADNVSYDEDRDYVALFSTISYFFSLLIAFFKRFENFRNDEELLREQVRGWGLNFDEGSVTLEQLQYLAENYYSQIQQRGTAMIATREGDILPNGSAAVLDGELARLLHNKACNELLIGAVSNSKMGWCVGNSSPLYRGTCQEVTLNKTPEDTKDFQSQDHFPLNFSGTQYRLFLIDGTLLAHFLNNNEKAVIGRFNSYTDISEYLIPIDPEISYEITIAFKYKLLSGIPLGNVPNFYFGVEGFDNKKQKLNDAFISLGGEMNNGEFFNHSMQMWKKDVWYYARGIIHAYNTKPVNGVKTNLGIGSDLIFNNSFVRYMYPQIIVSSASRLDCEVSFWDFKIRPLVRGKSILPYRNLTPSDSHSLGFIQARDFLYTYARNNNNSLSKEEITNIIEKYLYPFGKTNMFVFAGEK